MLNKIVLMGRLTAAPELRYTGNQIQVVNFTLAVERDYTGSCTGKQTDFIKCVAWRSTAEFIARHFGKGELASVTGSLQSKSFTDKDNNKRTDWEVIVDHIYFTGDRKSQADSSPPPAPVYTTGESNAFSDYIDADGELPF